MSGKIGTTSDQASTTCERRVIQVPRWALLVEKEYHKWLDDHCECEKSTASEHTGNMSGETSKTNLWMSRSSTSWPYK